MQDERYLSAEEIKNKLVEMLNEFDSFCKKEGLIYYLTWGTLLGSIRHKGFIPWDDDIDLWMPRFDYNKLIDKFHHPEYSFISMEIDPYFPLCSGKICDPRYSAVDEFGKDFGLYIDIFPIDGLPESSIKIKRHINRVKRAEKLWSNQVITSRYTISGNYSLNKNLKIIAAKFLKPFLPIESVINHYLHRCSLFPFDYSDKVISYDAYIVFDRALFATTLFKEFEGRLYPVPVGYDDVLRIVYGDYMKVPPESERTSHGIKVYMK
jgi:lipopolysaccharide cholinephosphotransferase